jgi:hypothetical protein
MILTAVCAQISISETRGAMLHCFISMPVALNILCLDNPLVGLALFVFLLVDSALVRDYGSPFFKCCY